MPRAGVAARTRGRSSDLARPMRIDPAARDKTLERARRILLERDQWDDLAGLAGS